MEDFAFSIRPPVSPIGFGAVPEGLGQHATASAHPSLNSIAIPHGSGTPAKHKPHPHRGVGSFAAASPQKANWVLAYVYGERAPRVKIKGSGFDYAKVLQQFVQSGQPSQYFTWTGTGGTFLFSCIYSGSTPVVRLATNGLQRGMGRKPTGMGDITPGTVTCNASWITINSPGPNADSFSLTGSDISGALTTMKNAWSLAMGGKTTPFTVSNGAMHFIFSSDHTANIPMKYDGVNLYACGVPVTVAPSSPPAVQPIATQGVTPISGGTSVDNGTYTWDNYMWVYQASGSNDSPNGSPPPGQPAGVSGAWVNVSGNQWNYYPNSGPQPLPVVDPTGVTWWTYSSANAAMYNAPSSAYMPPLPGSTVPPASLAGTSGSWSGNVHSYYQVWIPTAGMTDGEILALVLLGALGVGGVAYLVSQ